MNRGAVHMEDQFPLSLPTGACAVSLPWHDHDDQAWIVEVEPVGHTSTWTFGKRELAHCMEDSLAVAGLLLQKTMVTRRSPELSEDETAFGPHLCLHRFKLWWLKPSHGRSGLDVPPETALLLAERRPPLPNPGDTRSTGALPLQHEQHQHQREYVVLLPVSDTHARASLHRAGDNAASTSSGAEVSSTPSSPSLSGAVPEDHDPSALAVSADTGDAATLLPGKLGVLLVATGFDPFRLVRRLVREATERLRAQLLALSLEEQGGPVAVGVAVASGRAGGAADVAGDGVAAAAAAEGDDSAAGGGRGGGPKDAREASFVDTFGWCTWDSFYTMVTPEGVLEGLSTLRQGGVRPRWVVLDDGWQSTTNDDALNTEQWDERLVRFEANKRFRRFDEEGRQTLDLGDTVRRMKKDFGVEQVLAWHAMTGYWAGVEPEAPEMAPFDPHVTALSAPEGIREVDPEMQPELDEKRFGMVKPSRAEGFYLAYHKYLKENGVDGVKVDAQSILDCMGRGSGGVPAVAKAYHEGLCRSVQATFEEGGKPAALIHCMCHAPSVLLLIACVSQDRVVLRGSDDFYPREENSHGPHLYSNAFNALLLSNLGIQDWDMFQTGLGLEGAGETAAAAGAQGAAGPASASSGEGLASWFHAAARAISGGPVYVSDRPGQHNRDILSRLVLDDGSVLRASTNALPTLDCLFRDPQQDGGGLLQVWALNALPGTGVVGSFNVQGASFSQSERTWVRHHSGRPGDDARTAGGEAGVKGTVSPSDVYAFLPTKKKAPTARAGEGCAASTETETETETRPSSPGNARADGGRRRRSSRQRDDDDDNEDEGEGGESDDTAEEGCFAVYLHRRREARVVGLREAVGVEVLPLGYELATFSRVIDLRVSPSAAAAAATATTTATATATATATVTATAVSESQKPERRFGGGVKWAALGLASMFNSSAAVTSQVTTGAAFASRRSPRPPGEGGAEERDEALRESSGVEEFGSGGGAGVGVSLTVKGSGRFLAAASRKPVACFCGAPGRGSGDTSEGAGSTSDGVGFAGGVGDGGGGGDGSVVLQVSFSALASFDESTEDGTGTGAGTGTRACKGGTQMGLVEVDIPGPWDGRERRLVFRWGSGYE